MSDLKTATLLDANPLAGLSLLLLVAILVSAYLWSSTAMLDEVTRGEGKVIPSSREQVIQSLEGGILAELMVREGDLVEVGDILLRIDDTKFGASYREGKSHQQSLRTSIVRLEAEASGAEPVFPDDIPADIIEAERALYQSRLRSLRQSISSIERSLTFAERELKLTAPLVEKGVVSEVEVLRLRRQVNDLRATIQDKRNAFRSESRTELSKKEAELAGVREINTAREDQLNRAIIRSPVRGTIKNVKLNTVGGVIQPGMDILEIVPIEDQLLIEARIKPADVAFLKPGLPATVKIAAYDFSIYGGLEGILEHISADTLNDGKNPNESFYRILIRTKEAYLQGRDGRLPIIPGMTATAEILTGHKTVFDYLIKPILKTRDLALRER